MSALLSVALLACVKPPERAGSGSEKVSEGAPPTQAEAVAPVEAEPAPRRATIPADGWNEDIAWRGLDEGLAEASRTGRPLMMVVHTSWCPKCKALKGEFNGNETIATLSEQFVMVHADQDAVPEASLYAPDGTYIPRVVFLDSKGALDEELGNPRRTSRYRYFYTPQEDLVGTMREALDRHGNKT